MKNAKTILQSIGSGKKFEILKLNKKIKWARSSYNKRFAGIICTEYQIYMY